VDVVLRVGREVIVEDAVDFLDVDPTGGHVGGDERTGLSSPELCERTVTLLLAAVTVDRDGSHA
jgi:hypothetical protein